MLSEHEDVAPTRALAERLAQQRLTWMQRPTVSVTSAPSELELGGAFAVRGHPRAELNRAYRAVGATWFVERGYGSSTLHGQAMLQAVPLDTPPAPRQRFQRHSIAGPQTATVIAPPAGQTVDGHVRVRLAWPASPEGEIPSAWVPVHGAARPQPGEAVLLHFLDGDPARPIVWHP